MLSDRIRSRELVVSQVEGRIFVGVPWDRADQIQDRLRGQGIGSTLHLDPRGREARLELWTNLRLERVRELLDERTPAPPLRAR
jgi:hypothetical protein